MTDFTHFNEQGRAKMVDVGDKKISTRTAIAAGRVLVSENTFRLIQSGGMKKGDVLTVAQIAGVMGAKRTPDLIPMCHPILMDGINLNLSLDEKDDSACQEFFTFHNPESKQRIRSNRLLLLIIGAILLPLSFLLHGDLRGNFNPMLAVMGIVFHGGEHMGFDGGITFLCHSWTTPFSCKNYTMLTGCWKEKIFPGECFYAILR